MGCQTHRATSSAAPTFDAAPSQAPKAQHGSVRARPHPHVRPARGDQIAFLRSGHSGSAIYLLDVNTRHETELTQGKGSAQSPFWSPDGRKIAFRRWVNDGLRICVMDADGSHEKGLTRPPGIPVSFAWAPGGKALVYVLNPGAGQNWKICSVEVATGRTTDLCDSFRIVTAVACDPSGTRIAFTGARSMESADPLYIMNRDGTGVRQLTTGNGICYQPVWSPDGGRIAFPRDYLDKEGDCLGQAICVLDIGSGQQKWVTDPVGRHGPSDSGIGVPRWSPKGSRLLFNNNGRVCVMNADGTAQRLLSAGPTRDNTLPRWSPGGSRIAFVVASKGAKRYQHIWVMNVDGKDRKELTDGPVVDWSPAWRPQP